MTKEDKQLLLKDLCARLPYGVKYNYGGNDGCDYELEVISPISLDEAFPITDCKPYLRPMSSMTEEEEKEYERCFQSDDTTAATLLVDFYNKRHFDYRGLIEKGLALEAPKDMYKTE